MSGRRVLITGLSTFWGGKLAQALERDERVEAIVGVDDRDPTRELDRTEFVRVSNQHALLRRIVEAAEIDTVVDTRMVVDSVTTSPRKAHENNVIGTMNILAACSHSSVRSFLFKSSAHFYGTAQDDPAFFTESMGRPHPPTTPIERDIVEAEASVRDFAEKNPQVSTTILRMSNVLGPEVRTSHTELFSRPAVPTMLGFDPRYQFVHEDDVVEAAAHALRNDLAGIYNVAGDGVLALTEVVSLLGRPWVPLLSPWGTGLQAQLLRRLGLHIPPEMLGQLRFGRGLDNRKLKATGFEYRYTSREAVMALGEHLRLHPVMRGASEPYKYEREVEDFLRWSPHVRNRKDQRMTPEELLDLGRLHRGYAGRIGMPPTASPQQQAEAMARAAGASGDRPATEAEPQAADGTNGGDPAEPGVEPPEPAPPRRAAEPARTRASEPARTSAAEVAPPAGDAPPPTGEPLPPPTGAPVAPPTAHDPGAQPIEHYDDVRDHEIVALLDSLETADLLALRDHERGAGARPRVLAGIEGVLARREAARRG